jgi:hypothetical protein
MNQYGMFWGVTVKDLLIDGSSIGAASSSYGGPGSTIIDSGTTYTYIPTALAGPFKAKWLAVTGFAYDTNNALAEGTDVDSLPDLHFVLEKKVGKTDILVLKMTRAWKICKE